MEYQNTYLTLLSLLGWCTKCMLLHCLIRVAIAHTVHYTFISIHQNTFPFICCVWGTGVLGCSRYRYCTFTPYRVSKRAKFILSSLIVKHMNRRPIAFSFDLIKSQFHFIKVIQTTFLLTLHAWFTLSTSPALHINTLIRPPDRRPWESKKIVRLTALDFY